MSTATTLEHARTGGSQPGETRSPQSGRLAWADVAKGVCILLVVLHHTTVKHFVELVPEQFGVLGEGWYALSQGLKPVRMPLFFVLSGFFVASALDRPWRQVLRARVLNPYYLYVVWLLIAAVVFSFERTLTMNRTQNAGELLWDLVYPSTGVWFLFALAAYFVIAKATRPLDARLVVAVATVVAASISALPVTETNRISVLHHGVYFLVGARFPGLVRDLAAPRSRRMIAALVGGYVAGALVTEQLNTPFSLRMVLLAPVGVWAAVQLTVVATRWGAFERVATAIGRRTLPIYVLHMPLLAVVHVLMVDELDLGHAWMTGTALVVYPVITAAAILASCLGVQRMLVALGATALFSMPTVRLRTSSQQVRSRAQVTA